ncbi:hypothetical protein HDV05_004143 [Chytridiales sp. JEL 0842]|nr:hypothetical protein HDV05_004143 [Chytridiales sp. JEL 0842]
MADHSAPLPDATKVDQDQTSQTASVLNQNASMIDQEPDTSDDDLSNSETPSILPHPFPTTYTPLPIQASSSSSSATTTKKKKKKKKKSTADPNANPPPPRKPRPLFIDDPNWTGSKVIPAGWGDPITPSSSTATSSAASSSAVPEGERKSAAQSEGDSKGLPKGWDDGPVQQLLREAMEREELKKMKIAAVMGAQGALLSQGVPSGGTSSTVSQEQEAPSSTKAATSQPPPAVPKAPKASGWDTPIVGVTFLSTGITRDMAENAQEHDPQEPWDFAPPFLHVPQGNPSGPENIAQPSGSRIEEIDD